MTAIYKEGAVEAGREYARRALFQLVKRSDREKVEKALYALEKGYILMHYVQMFDEHKDEHRYCNEMKEFIEWEEQTGRSEE